MAMFREHIAFGAVVSMAVVAGIYFYALITDPWLLAILFGIVIVGSFLPDVDSDSGLPFYLVYGTVSVIASGYVTLWALTYPPSVEYIYWLLGVPALALVFFWFIVGGVVKRYTRHRGMFHSAPAAALAGLAVVVAARAVGLGETESLILGAGMTVGYLTHLVLDEMHSLVDLEGIPFIPKKSLGTALKFFSSSTGANVTVYSLIVFLTYLTVS